MRSYHRIDNNHKAVRDVLRKSGWLVLDLSRAGKGVPDLFIAKAGRVMFCEVKNGAAAKADQVLTPAQETLHASFAAAGVPVVVVNSVEEAVRL